MRDADAVERRAIAVNAAAYHRIAEAATSLVERGEHELAARYVQDAARLAYRNQVGGFGLGALDDLAATIAATEMPAWTGRTRGARERVLHVLSESYDHGGHTRLVEQWISRDRARDHVIALTRQEQPAPRLVATVQPFHVPIVSVGGPEAPILRRAVALRELAGTFNLVVLHIHPDDGASAIGMQAGPGRPPTVVMNHANIDTWIGADLGDAVACLRPMDARITIERRGVPAERTLLLPLPVSRPADPPDRATARQRLGLKPDVEIVLTVAHPRKYGPLTEHSLGDALVAFVQARPGAHVLAVGPEPHHTPWAQVCAAVPGRVHPVGARTDLPLFYAAADVYVESFPIAGGTVVLEAAFSGLPVVCYRPFQVAEGALEHEPIGEDLRTLAPDDDAFVEGVSALLDDPDEASRRARALADQLYDDHVGATWTERMEAVYDRARAHAGTGRPVSPRPRLGVVDPVTTVLCRHTLQGAAQPAEQVAAHAASLELAVDSPAARARLRGLLWGHACPLPHPARGALAVPQPDGSDAAALLAGLRALRAAGFTGTCALAVPRAEAERCLALLQPILTRQDAEAGWELDVDIMPFDGPEPVLPPEWIPVVADDRHASWAGETPVHPVTAARSAAAA